MEHRKGLMWLSLLLLVLLLAFGVTRLQFVEDISSFFPENGQNRRINHAYQHIGSENRLVINVRQKNRPDTIMEEGDVEMLTEVVDTLAAALVQHDPDSLMKGVLYKVDEEQVEQVTTFVVQNLPYFLEEQDYARMDSFMNKKNIVSQLVEDQMFFNSITEKVILSDPLFFSGPVLKKLEGFRLSNQYQERDGYIFNQKGNEAMVLVTSKFAVSETQNNARLIQQIEAAIAEVQQRYSGVEISVFGASMVSQTNAQQIKKDSMWAVLLSLVLIVALLIYYYRNFKSILLIVCTITFGALVAAGVIVWLKNPISIIAVGVASIILGVAVNYPIHLLSHFKKTGNKVQIIRDVVPPLLIGNITTVGAFLSLLFISSDAMRDLGLFAALLLVGTILFVLVFLPHLLGKRPKKWDTAQLSFKKVAEFKFESHAWIVVVILGLTVLFFCFSFRTSFETDMHKINYMTEEQQAAFQKIREESDSTVQRVFCVSEGTTPDEAFRNYEKMAPILNEMLKDSLVKAQSGISVFLPSQEMQRQRIARWEQFWQSHRESFLKDFKVACKQTGWQPFGAFYDILEKEYQPQPVDYFAPILQNIASSYVVQEDGKSMVYNILTVDKNHAEQVEEKLNAVDENVFSFTDRSMIERMISALSGDFNYVLYICGFIVFAFLLFSFGRLEIALTAFVPLTIAWIWILGIMGLMDIKFNIVNIILATFIFGQGDDYAIFVTEGAMYEYRTGRKMLAQFKNSILLSAIIMFVSIGMLIFAKHPAMRSLAEVTVIGMFSVVMMAYIFPPLIFKWLTSVKGQLRPVPLTLWNMLKTCICFFVFFVTSLVLTLWALFCWIFFHRNKKVKYAFHALVTGIFRRFARWMFQVKHEVLNPQGESFDKPAVLIANHQSHLDLMYILMLTPKMVVLTNQWVWNCPFYRWIIRYADFLPVANGIERNIPQLEQLVKQGYSILVFPEGTRSADCQILRFHQGAFYLARALKLDVVPIICHGIGHVFPKKEFVLHNGRVTVEIKERIPVNDPRFWSEDAKEMARAFRKYYMEAYRDLASRVETADYYRHAVMCNYIYKGTEVSRAMHRQFKNFNLWKRTIDEMPETGSVLLLHSGQGEFALLAALVKKNLKITAVEENEDLLDVASHCSMRPHNLSYLTKVDESWHFDKVIDLYNIEKQ
ncbi:MAG: MMPL family transporter [Bacteroidales bacterium]|nr:MMPL family transporter [Bacteroidales bacterium]